MHSSGFFQIKLIARLILKREISGSHTISDQSLLLSTIILNDIYTYIYIYIYIKTHGSESRGQEEAGLRDEPVSYLQIAPL